MLIVINISSVLIGLLGIKNFLDHTFNRFFNCFNWGFVCTAVTALFPKFFMLIQVIVSACKCFGLAQNVVSICRSSCSIIANAMITTTHAHSIYTWRKTVKMPLIMHAHYSPLLPIVWLNPAAHVDFITLTLAVYFRGRNCITISKIHLVDRYP